MSPIIIQQGLYGAQLRGANDGLLPCPIGEDRSVFIKNSGLV